MVTRRWRRPARAPRTGERGFTLAEVLISLIVTAIGMVGVLFMLMSTIRANRAAQMATRATQYAEQLVELVRGEDVTTLTGGVTFADLDVNGVVYTPTVTVTDLAASSNLMLISVEVAYDLDGDADSTEDDRRAVLQLIRTKTEAL